MCGIVGKYYFENNDSKFDDLQNMMNSIYHRGPDESGKYIDDKVALGFQRLSIIDTVTGGQPLYNEKKNILVIANGEIYNFKTLRSMLEARGHVFRTKSDCEVIVHLYEEYGLNFFSMLNGMFALCIYDMVKKIVLLARDRMGIKPLYYFKNNEIFVFASEIKGILACNDVPTRKEARILDEYLGFRYLSHGRTFFEGIKALEPGKFLQISRSGVESFSYWKPNYVFSDLSEKELIIQIEKALQAAVNRQMVSDVPLGTLLSGGVDSSWVSAIAGKLHEGLKTFSVGFHEKSYDETDYAKIVANNFSLNYNEIKIDNKKFSDNLAKTIWFHDEPLNHANSVQIHLICKYARENVKVLLTGEGADELFGGYPRYFICREGAKFNKLNKWIRNMIDFYLGFSSHRKIQKFKNTIGLDDKELILWNAQFSFSKKISWLLDKKTIDIEYRKSMLENMMSPQLDLIDNLLLFEQQTYLQSVLMRQDKLSMAASIESRVPMLDNEMIELANSINSKLKIKNYQSKYLLKKAAVRTLPTKVVYRKKVGFGVPISSWLRDQEGLGRYLSLLLDVANNLDGIKRKNLEQIIKEHNVGEENHEDILWPLINYAIWSETFF